MASTMRSAPSTVAGRERLDLTLPAPRHLGGIASERLALAQEPEPHAVAPLAQQARRHEAVAAVVAGPAGHRHPDFAVAEKPGSGIGDGPARGLHQRQARDAAGDRQAVGAPHLHGGQQLVPGQGPAPALSGWKFAAGTYHAPPGPAAPMPASGETAPRTRVRDRPCLCKCPIVGQFRRCHERCWL